MTALSLSVVQASVVQLADGIQSSIARDGHYRLGLRLAAVLVILHGASARPMGVPLTIVGGALLLFPPILTHAILWWTLVGVLILGNAQGWDLIDNHKYLITYWVLACALSVQSKDPRAYLNTSARVLAALVFGLAVFWKLVGGEYIDGSFLYWTFVTDPRVQRVGAVLGGTSFNDVLVSAQAIRALGIGGVESAVIPVIQLPSLRSATLAASWLVVIGEAAVAILHAFGSSRLYLARHLSLIAFILGTYFLLPVSGFAFVLTLLGFAQCRAEDGRLAGVYLALLAVMQFAVLPWQTLLTTG